MEILNKRDRLINSAATLFHRRGILATSLADIAKDADIPIGNVYYYFKTKEELALSALSHRKEQTIALLDELDDTISDPRERLKTALDHYESRAEEFARYGCPVGKMVMDAEGPQSPIGKAAADVFACFLGWAELQFKELGHEENAGIYAASLVCGIQGAGVLAKALGDAKAVTQELGRLTHFIDQLPNKRVQLGKVSNKVSVA